MESEPLAENLPDPVIQHLLGAVLAQHPAWMTVDHAGRVESVGGDFAHFGIEVRVGARLPPDHPLAGGLGPSPRSLTVSSGRSAPADLRTIPTPTGHVLLLLDPPAPSARPGGTPEAGEDADTDKVLAGALAGLGLLVLERRAPGVFASLGTVPEWAASRIRPGDPTVITDVFPFLETFLPEAEALWSRTSSEALESGIWTESSPHGDKSFEARAICLDEGGGALVIETETPSIAGRRAVIQRARVRALEQDSFLRDVEKKELLLHCIVHDLRGPLTALTASLSLLGSGKLPAPRAESTLRIALRAGQRQEQMINNILEVFSSGSRTGRERFVPVDLVHCAEGELIQFAPALELKGLKAELVFGPEDQRFFVAWADRGRLGRVFANLFDNALRHMPPAGFLRVDISLSGAEIIVAVENEGPQVAESLRPYLFDRFVRDPDNGGAAGLGLFYCRITIERFGGRIWYEPTESGSRFVFALPVGPVTAS